MTESFLTDSEARALIGLEKVRVDEKLYQYPQLSESLAIPLASVDHGERFILDIIPGKRVSGKVTYQNRARSCVVLVRLDLGGPPHVNPDGSELSCPHIHIYREGYGTRWAYPVNSAEFSGFPCIWDVLSDFMNYCNITKQPLIERGLFV
jgi:hypothetical protein